MDGAYRCAVPFRSFDVGFSFFAFLLFTPPVVFMKLSIFNADLLYLLLCLYTFLPLSNFLSPLLSLSLYSIFYMAAAAQRRTDFNYELIIIDGTWTNFII